MTIGMERQWAGEALFSPDRALQDLRGELGRFAVVDLPADDLPAEDVDDCVLNEPAGAGLVSVLAGMAS